MFNLIITCWIIYVIGKRICSSNNVQMGAHKVLPKIVVFLQSIVAKLDNKHGARHRRRESANSSSHMSLEEAYQILGVQRGASKQEITQAFKKLMMVNHPDKGGSEYIAAKIIQAKQKLISE